MSKVYFQKPSSWSNAYAYVYSSVDSNVKNATWHGVQMTNLGNGLYSYDVSSNLGVSPYVIFNDGGTLQYPTSGGLQITSDSMILYTSNTWTVYNLGTSTVSTTTIGTSTVDYYTGTNGLLIVNNILLFAIICILGFVLALNRFFGRA